MPTYFADAKGIPEYIIMLEAAQQKASRAYATIDDSILLAFATNTTLASGLFPPDCDTWESKLQIDKQWDAWKKHFTKFFLARENRLKAAGEEGGGTFGSANADIKGIRWAPHLPPQKNATPSHGVLPPPAVMDHLNSCPDHMANAATSNKVVL